MPKVSVIVPVVRTHLIEGLKENVLKNSGVPEEDIEFIWEEDTEHIGALFMTKKLVDRVSNDLICWLGDDTVPQPNFLKNALDVMGDNWLVGFNDEHSTKATHWMAHKNLLDHMENREFFFTGYYHNFSDDELRIKTQKLNKYIWCKDAVVRHNHPYFGTAEMDEHYKKVMSTDRWKHDHDLFIERNGKISVCMIVKNEEAMLAECLETVKGAYELIIVDTGSTDKTKEIAARYTDKIYDFTWCDDFSAARNEAKKYATGDWILSIDADELLDTNGLSRLQQHFSQDFDGIFVILDNQHGDLCPASRCFRNFDRIQWVAPVHEAPSVRDNMNCDVKIFYRTSPAHALDPDLDFRILRNQVDNDCRNTRALFYLAREYAYRAQYELAIMFFQKYLEHSEFMAERCDALWWTALCFWRLQKGEEARRACLLALSINANFKAAIDLMAEMSWDHNAKQWKKMSETATNEGCLFTHA